MAGKAKSWPVDGGWMTVGQAAEMLGVKRQQLYSLMSNHSCGLQAAVNLVRQNLVLNGQNGSERHMVDGRWMTVNQAAEMLGRTPVALREYRYRHRDAQGRPATLQDTVDHYRQGVRRGGHGPKLHRVGRRTMTTFEVAERYGVSVESVRSCMHYHKCGLAACVNYYEKKKRRKAEKAIMNILGY